jgi:hypothetical protein
LSKKNLSNAKRNFFSEQLKIKKIKIPVGLKFIGIFAKLRKSTSDSVYGIWMKR